jgi:phenylacetate-CoA ligase
VLRRHGLQHVLDRRTLDLPVLLHYGRSDLSLDYNGAVVSPDGLRDVLDADPELLAVVESHRLVSFEDGRGDRQLHLAVQLADGADVADRPAAARRVLAGLRRANGDFHQAVRTCPPGTEPTVGFYPYRTGVFAGDGARLKNEYAWTLDAAAAATAGIDAQVVAERG